MKPQSKAAFLCPPPGRNEHAESTLPQEQGSLAKERVGLVQGELTRFRARLLEALLDGQEERRGTPESFQHPFLWAVHPPLEITPASAGMSPDAAERNQQIRIVDRLKEVIESPACPPGFCSVGGGRSIEGILTRCDESKRDPERCFALVLQALSPVGELRLQRTPDVSLEGQLSVTLQ